MEKHGVSAYAVSQKTGIAQSEMSKILKPNTERMPTIAMLIRIADAIGCDIREFFGGVSNGVVSPIAELRVHAVRSLREAFESDEGADSFVPVPLLRDSLSLGPGLVVNEVDRDGWALIHTKWLKQGMEPYAVWVRGDSMEPILSDGDMVAIDVKQTNPKHLTNCLVAYKIKDEVGVKWLVDRHDSWYFKAENRNWEEENGQITTKKKDGVIVGKVVFCWRKFT